MNYFRRALVSLGIVKVPVDPTLTPTEILDPIVAPELEATEVHQPAPVDAAISLLLVIEREIGDKPLPSDLREISNAVHEKVAKNIRDDDSASTRAEFALTIQRGALFLRAMKDWYDAP